MNYEVRKDSFSLPNVCGKKLEELTIQERMIIIFNIRSAIGEIKDHWYNASKPIPQEDMSKIEQAENLGVKIFETLGFEEYLGSTQKTLDTAFDYFEKNNVLSEQGCWPELTLEQKKIALTNVLGIFAKIQSREMGIEVKPAPIEWVRRQPFEAHTDANYKMPPEEYKISLNSDMPQFMQNMWDAIRAAMHEQIHIAQATLAHKRFTSERLPSPLEGVADYLIEQTECYIPSWRSEKLFSAQINEKAALLATNYRP
ncbi:MAG TPA: hypothetical protein PLK94_09160 [Alphaproteobacteria bacterium]|nr:hypothetical protein [Alphaproteobacteria bacterium]HOO51440.1 hypothetical protein [Alphaproteobacteria bacterium]